MLLLFFNSICYGQHRTSDITGIVTDINDQPLSNVSIITSQSRLSSITNEKGVFHISNAVLGESISFSMIGYEPQTIIVRDTASIKIQLELGQTKLDEVVVIGYGEVNKEDLTGAVGVVDVEALQKAPVATFDEALAGRIAGVQVSSNEGQPGSDINITIRGGNSLTQSNSPLYVIDGFPIEDFSSSAVSPDDIKSINVLKDASATAIYGSRGANGVIIIETKTGIQGAPVITYNGFYGKQYTTKKIEMMSVYDFLNYQMEINPERTTETYFTRPGKTLEDYRNEDGVDWQGLMFRPATMHNHNLSVRGGSTNTKYTVSGNVLEQDGIILNSGYRRRQVRIGLEQRLTDKIKGAVNFNYSDNRNYGSVSSNPQSDLNAYASYMMYRVWGYRPVSSGFDIVEELVDEEDISSVVLINPVIAAENEIRQHTETNFMLNGKFEYSILKGLTLNIKGGYRGRMGKNESFFNSKTYRGFPSTINFRGVNGIYDERGTYSWVNENTLNYKRVYNKIHRVDAIVGFTMQESSIARYGFEAINIADETVGLRALSYGIPTNPISMASKNALASYLGRINYGLKSKYLFTASLRADGSSKFSAKNRWGWFPSGAFAWQLGKEELLKDVDAVSDAKLRLSYGVTGNNRIADFARFQNIDINDFYSFNNELPVYAAIIDNMGNSGLKWERTAQLDLGIDFSLFNNRINSTVDLYRKTTDDLLLNSNLPATTGFTTVFKNIGKIRNDGLEITVNTVNLKNKDFGWESGFNIAFNRNKVLALADNQTSIPSPIRFTGDFNNTFLYLAQIGGPASVFYGLVWDGNYQYEDFNLMPDGTHVLKPSVPTNGNDASTILPGDVKFVDQNGDGIVNEEDMVVLGRAIPVHIGGFNNNFFYRGFSLNVFLQWSYGNKIMNANRMLFEGDWVGRANFNQFASYNNRWTPDNPTEEYPRAGGSGPRGVYSDRTLEDGSYLRLKTVQLNYAFPPKSIKGIKTLEVYAAGQNLITWTNYTGYDPEVSVRNTALTPGFDFSAYPRALTVTVGAKVGF
ncbi:TonB-dependent receptor [Sphingobacterium sp. SGG-5]|uniref:SusC/RagA family TonB-linked outer membrane protein n=1 Tax=Sphingobacterium sp. SGG-5 TaxID=2710881 RepID=UPI0013E9AA91|nr:TonB-dependent receptor [Sphingobacterium sp. SGG-5]NGM61481.1 TonB-dependent receptor [Sphingobacterium sp. SGG-5]